ncbi:MAG: DUF4433 domain-containing protein [Burkholderiales bacterium]|nr:DUF4433 domain-containing protein [Burkholderiales bacterium]
MDFVGNIRGCLERYGDLTTTHKWFLRASTELNGEAFQQLLDDISTFLSKDGRHFAEPLYVIIAQIDPEAAAIMLVSAEKAQIASVTCALAQVSSEHAEKLRAAIISQIAAREEQRKAEVARAIETERQAALRLEESRRRQFEEARAAREHERSVQARRQQAKQRERQRQIDVFGRYGVVCVTHITHIDNMPTILRDGLVARHALKQPFVDIADLTVNARRERAELVYERSIHAYVPLYFNAVNAMLSAKRDVIPQLVFLQVAISLIVPSERRWLITDGNAAADATHFFNSVDDLKHLDWKCLRANYWNDIPDGKRTRCAEMLVETCVPTEWIVKIDCFSKATMGRVKSLTENNGAIKVALRANPFP